MLRQIIANDLVFDLILIVNSLVLISLVFVFVVYRRNTKRKIDYLESLQSDYKGISELISPPAPVEPPDNFKIAIQNHLNEISERLKSNEKLTNSLINQLDAIRDAWFEQTEDTDENQPKSSEEAQDEEPKINPESGLSDETIHQTDPENEQENK
jgi:hypothetical protein